MLQHHMLRVSHGGYAAHPALQRLAGRVTDALAELWGSHSLDMAPAFRDES